MAKKSLGQNFLLDPQLLAKIVRAAGTLDGKNVIEVGPGPGGLTRAILEAAPRSVHAIERDDRCVAALQSLITASSGILIVHPDDALNIDYKNLCPAPRVLIANLPYNIATPLLMSWLERLDLFDSLTLMFQKEVAERITAPPGNKVYGRLSVMAQWLCQVEKKFDIPPGAFLPPPKVTSSVVRFSPIKDRTDNVDIRTMEKVTAAAFGQRRKMLRQSLKSLTPLPEKLLEAASIAPTLRAEDVDIKGFVRLAQAFLGFSVETKS